MTIHHATKEKAAKVGIILTEHDDYVDAHYPKTNRHVTARGAKDALAALTTIVGFEAENVGLRVLHDGDTYSVMAGEEALSEGEDLAETLAEALESLTDEQREALAQADADEQDEDDARSGSVVPDKYKLRYKENGTPNTCGDWLAITLKDLTTDKADKLDPDAVEEIARLNDVDTSKLNRTSNGWQGRFRMTTRNMLVKVVAVAGHLNVPAGQGDKGSDSCKAPKAWCLANAPKIKEAAGKKATGV